MALAVFATFAIALASWTTPVMNAGAPMNKTVDSGLNPSFLESGVPE